MTDAALVLAPLACGAVLVVSGVAKARDTDGTRAAMISVGLPPRLSSTATATALCAVELALGALVLVTWGWVLAVVAAAVTALFAAYWLVVGRVLRRGEDVECHCFGSLGSDRVTSATLLRNTVLVLLALLAVGFGVDGHGVPVVLDDLGGAGWAWLAMTVLVGAAAVLIVAPGREPHAGVPDVEHDTGGDPEEQLDYERSDIPFAILADADGRQVTLRTLAQRQAQLLVFLSVGCGACTVILEKLSGWSRQLEPVQVQAVYTSYLADVPEHYRVNGVTSWHDVEGGATAAFCHNGRPVAVLLGADGQLAGGPVLGREAIGSFVEDILAELHGEEAAPDEQAHDQADARA